MSRRTAFLVLVCGLGLAACKKKEPPAAAVPPPVPEQPQPVEAANEDQPVPPTPAQPERPAPPPTPALVARAENVVRPNVVGEVDTFLTGELRNFVQQKHRMPVSFAEFAGLRLDSVPRPPEGKKWVIDTESLEVKAVSEK